MKILVHYGEIALKGKNRPFFENKLKSNIEKATVGKVEKLPGRMIVETEKTDGLAYVFGIIWYASVFESEKNYQSIKTQVLKGIKEKVKNKPTFALKITRADKDFPLTSQQLAEKLGQEIVDNFNLKVDLNHPDLSVFIEISKSAYIFFEKKKGLAGLPIGVSGKALSFLSGGIDSVVSSYLMLKRGCQLDFLHFHVFPKNDQVKGTKIEELVKNLNKYQFKAKLFALPYYNFQLCLKNCPAGYELIIFRRFMSKVAEKIARGKGYQALVAGDNLGQVASQTMENIAAVDVGVEMSILRPLLSFDKQEIINLAKKIGSYKISIKPYKDCCSIISRHPKTKPKLGLIEKIEKENEIDQLVDKTLTLSETFTF